MPVKPLSTTRLVAVKMMDYLAVSGRSVSDKVALCQIRTTLREMGEVAAIECDPLDDNRSSAEYRWEMVNVLGLCPSAENDRKVPSSSG